MFSFCGFCTANENTMAAPFINSPNIVVGLLLLLLHAQQGQPDLILKHPETNLRVGHQVRPSQPVNHQYGLLGGLPQRRPAGDRPKRQAFDFSMNTPPPKSGSPQNDSAPGSGEASPAPDQGGDDGTGGGGQDLGAFLGSLLGSSGPTDNSSAESQDPEQDGEAGDLPGSSANSSSPQEGPGKSETSTEPPGSEVGDSGVLLGSGNGTVNGSESGQGGGGGLGDFLSGLLGPSTSSDNNITGTGSETTSSTCTGLNMCLYGHQCQNGGSCQFNASSCAVTCLCPPPYDDPELYDQTLCSRIATPETTTPGPPPPPPTASPCTGLNMCLYGYACQNGGTCHFNPATCVVSCLCPPPYDDPALYDQRWCSLRPSTTTTTAAGPTSRSPHPPPPAPTTTTTLRPREERECRDVTCIHGYCNATDLTRDPCRCDPGWQGFFCDVGCFRRCANGGRCTLDHVRDKEKCVCPDPWRGDNCTERKPDPSGADRALVYWLSGSFAVGLVLMVTLGSLFMFYLWRKRLVFALKVVYYFLPYEDNDGRLYDAFVSYVLEDADERFVYDHLRPKLESELGFNLCLHQRDFLVGGVISDSILDALENSRRFILILTPGYLKNEWAEFEFQRAFHEMLKRKLRIIPIILEDVSTCSKDSLTPTLKTILESVTVLEYPGSTSDDRRLHKFWKQVNLCMPKRKKKEEEADMLDKSRTNEGTFTHTEDINVTKNKHEISPSSKHGGHGTSPEAEVVELYSDVSDGNGDFKYGQENVAVDLSHIDLRDDFAQEESGV